MPSRNLSSEWRTLSAQLQDLNSISLHDNLSIYSPTGRHMRFFRQLLTFYERATARYRDEVRYVVAEYDGICNQLLGYVYVAIGRLKGRSTRRWLRRGLLAASIENCRFDYRDTLVALAKLYCAAEDADLGAQQEFTAVAKLCAKGLRGTLAAFSKCEILRETRRNSRKKRRRK
jgi:hypothetical protein